MRNYVNSLILSATVLCIGAIEAEVWRNLIPSEIVATIDLCWWTDSAIVKWKIARSIEVVDTLIAMTIAISAADFISD